MPNRMKPETLEETRFRLQEMSAAERRGFDAVSEGQLIPLAESPADPDGPEQELHQLNDALRLRRSIQDRPDEESVKQTQEAIAAPLAERRTARQEAGRLATADTRATARRSTRRAEGTDGQKAE
jgi:hypothetical protein